MNLDECLPDARLHPVGPDKVTRSCPRELFTANTGAAPKAGRAAAAEVRGPTRIATAVWRCPAGELFPRRARTGAVTGP